MLTVVVAWSSSDDYYVTFVFVDDIMFSYNGTNVTESKTELCFVEFAITFIQGTSEINLISD